jgi:predicted ester cyclase
VKVDKPEIEDGDCGELRWGHSLWKSENRADRIIEYMNPEELKSVVKYEFEALWNRNNADAAEGIISVNFVFHEAENDIGGIEEFMHFINALHQSFPNAHFDIDDIIVDGDSMAVRYTFSGTHEGNYMGIAPTGKKVTATGIRFSRVAGDKLQESWNYMDRLSVLVQLGWWTPPPDWQLAFTWGLAVEIMGNATSDVDENKRSARRGLEELWNTGDLVIADEVYAIDFINHEITHRQYHDLESYKRYVAAIRSVLPDFWVAIDDIIAEGDKAAMRWNVSGTEKTSGDVYAWGGMSIFRFFDHKVVEAWWSRDALSVAQQMGIAPNLAK